ncbi:MAG: hypothetical protein P8L31_06240, partial [Pseudomonadales bacterium]|nr:hypothetical protein [Pseudomonadales bacterium]
QLFARTVAAIANFDLSVVDATVFTGQENKIFDTYTVLTSEGLALPRDTTLRTELARRIATAAIEIDLPIKSTSRRLNRQLRELPRPTKVQLKPTGDGKTTTLTIVANDRPGLLALIAELFVDLKLHLRSARIATLGEIVEDTFLIQNEHFEPVDEGEQTYTQKETIRQRIDAALKS